MFTIRAPRQWRTKSYWWNEDGKELPGLYLRARMATKLAPAPHELGLINEGQASPVRESVMCKATRC